MVSRYHNSLIKLKNYFLGGSEKTSIINYINANTSCSPISVLDIGSGDCSYIKKIVTELTNESILLTCIDPGIPINLSSNNKMVIIRKKFEFFKTENKFDVIISTQSAYYLSNKKSFLNKIFSILKPDGIFIVTLWSKNCVLYRLRKSILEDHFGPSDTAESFLNLIKSDDRFKVVETTYFKGEVDLKSIVKSKNLLKSLITIISRGDYEISSDFKLENIANCRLINEKSRENMTIYAKTIK